MDKMQMYREWAEKFLGSKTAPMPEDLSHTFISLVMMERGQEPIHEEIKQTFQYRIIRGRADFVGLQITDHAATLLSALADSPGEAVMYVCALRSTMGTNPIDIAGITELFPAGFPTEEELHKMWDAQKVDGSNLLDSLRASDFN